VQEHEVHEVNWVTKATRNFVSKEESLEILVGFDTQIGVFVAGLAQIEKNNSKQFMCGLISERRVECAIKLLWGPLYALHVTRVHP
jgi:hypothetical protein